jgi:hypothetical protein
VHASLTALEYVLTSSLANASLRCHRSDGMVCEEDKWVWAAQDWLPPLPGPRSSFGLVLSTVQALGLPPG